MNGNCAGNNDGIAADVGCWLRTRADAARHSLEGAGLDHHAETHAARKITNALAYAQAAGDIVFIVGEPGRGKTWVSQRYCAGKSNASLLGVSSAVHSLSGQLSVVGEAIGAGQEHRSALAAETAIIARLRDRQALLVVDEAHHLGDKLLDELCIIRDRSGCGLALLSDKSINMAFARCQQVDGCIGLKIDLTTQAVADVEDISAGILGRQPSRAELRILNTVGRGPGGLHALRRLLGRAWMVAQAAGRDEIEASDIAAATDEGVAAVDGAPDQAAG